MASIMGVARAAHSLVAPLACQPPCTSANNAPTASASSPWGSFYRGHTDRVDAVSASSFSGISLRHTLRVPTRSPLDGGRGGQRGAVLVTRAAVFDQLSTSLEDAWRKVSKEAILTRENMKEPMRDVRRALLEADVSLPVVRRFCSNVVDKAVGTEVIRGVRPDQKLIKVVNDELRSLMGGSVSELVFARSGPTVILLAGLQGVGKTTAAGKLALFLKKKNKKVMLVATDVYRPAAIDQLVKIGAQVDVPVFERGTGVKPEEIARQAMTEARKKKMDVVIIDTAGRLQINETLMTELKEMKRFTNPTEILLVVDAMTGQEAAALVAKFNEQVGITGAILTKVDGDSRGGAALSVKEISNRPIKFVGEGEGMTALEPFYPERMAGRILGMGDVLTLVEKAEETMAATESQELMQKMLAAKFDFNDWIKQTRMMAKMGSMANLLKMLPGMQKLTPQQIRDAEKNLKLMESMVNSMTKLERSKPELLLKSPSRRRRIAKGSGRSEQQVSELVNQLFVTRAKMQNLQAVLTGKVPPSMDQLQGALKAGRKAAPGHAKRRKRQPAFLADDDEESEGAEDGARVPALAGSTASRGFGSKK